MPVMRRILTGLVGVVLVVIGLLTIEIGIGLLLLPAGAVLIAKAAGVPLEA